MLAFCHLQNVCASHWYYCANLRCVFEELFVCYVLTICRWFFKLDTFNQICNAIFAWPLITFLTSISTYSYTCQFFCQHSWPSSLNHNFIQCFFDLTVTIYHNTIYVDNCICFNKRLLVEKTLTRYLQYKRLHPIMTIRYLEKPNYMTKWHLPYKRGCSALYNTLDPRCLQRKLLMNGEWTFFSYHIPFFISLNNNNPPPHLSIKQVTPVSPIRLPPTSDQFGLAQSQPSLSTLPF